MGDQWRAGHQSARQQKMEAGAQGLRAARAGHRPGNRVDHLYPAPQARVGLWNIRQLRKATMTNIQHTPDAYEEPEGLDALGSNLGDYPIDSVLVRTETRTVFDVIRRMKNKQYILDPDFQRDFVWEPDKQSKLIESALMRIPLPVFYLAEQADGNVVVVDGLQRLTTFYRYLSNEFALQGLTGGSQTLNGSRFDDLSPKLKTRLEDTNLTLYLIDSKVPEQAKLDIFERVNSGVPLSRQQMRNCLYVGNATRWLKSQAQSPCFKDATSSSLNPKTMRDREAINRFCGFYLLGIGKYRGDMDLFLAETLQHMNGLDKRALIELTEAFERSMKNNYFLFTNRAFRKHTIPTGRRSVINIALFDVFSVQMTKYDESFVKIHADQMRSSFYSLIGDAVFDNAISASTNSFRNVSIRFTKVEHVYSKEQPNA